MAVYDREEQERVEDLKAWWARWGNTVSWVAIGVAGDRRQGLALTGQ
jgi:predicted negative regulator of RcsB-dependent stress response